MKPYCHALKSIGILKSEFLYYKEFEDVEHFKEELKNIWNTTIPKG